MTTDNWTLGTDASLLDRATLRVFRWWRRFGSDFVRSYFLTQLTLAAILTVFLTPVRVFGDWHLIGAVAALVAPVAAWLVHRRRYGWRAPIGNQRAIKRGITLGILFFLATGVLLMVVFSYVAVVIGMLSPQGPLVLIPAVLTGAAGWLAATHRKRQLDNPIYPVDLR
jgi:hypothetical protein